MAKKINHKGYLRLLAIIIPFFLFVGLFQFVAATAFGVDIMTSPTQQSTYSHFILNIAGVLGTVFIVWLFTRFVDKEKFSKVGFLNQNIFNESLAGFAVGAGAIIIGFFVLFVSGFITVKDISFEWSDFLMIVSIYICVAVTEELLVRGYFLRNLMVSFNKYAAWILSSVIFSLMHAANSHLTLLAFINLFGAGLVLGLPYIFNKRLWFPIAFHFSWNWFQSLFGFNVSGLKLPPILITQTEGKDFITGGDFGFEGSIISVIVQFTIIVGFLYYFRKKEGAI